MNALLLLIFWNVLGFWAMMECEDAIPDAMKSLLGDSLIKSILAIPIWPVSVLVMVAIHWTRRKKEKRAQFF